MVDKYEKKWIVQEGIISYPYDWQQPAKTEEWVFDSLCKLKSNSKYIEFINFPWATLIDCMEKGQTNKADELLRALEKIPPKKTIIRATACQHIWASRISQLLLNLKITDLFWSHKNKYQNLIDGIRVHPLPLYPVSYYRNSNNFKKSLSERKYLFSFVGAYDPKSYLSKVRETIFSLEPRVDVKILKREQWHYEKIVYQEQINGEKLSAEEVNDEEKFHKEYTSIMEDTIFSLCPSGTGVNSIRLWESISHGCIPIILSDDYDDCLINPLILVKEREIIEFYKKICELKDLKKINYEEYHQQFMHAEELILKIFNDFNKVENILNLLKAEN